MSKYSIDGSNTFFLSIIICPFVGLSNPEIISINVVFPSPDLPKMQILSADRKTAEVNVYTDPFTQKPEFKDIKSFTTETNLFAQVML